MSVVVSAVAPGSNADMYEAVTGKVMPGDQLPDACELHIAGPAEQRLRVITVWESREAFDRFREEKFLSRCGRRGEFLRGLGGALSHSAVERLLHPRGSGRQSGSPRRRRDGSAAQNGRMAVLGAGP